MMSTSTLAILAAASALTLLGSWVYNGIAVKRGIVSHMNSRTLHERVVARGGGVIFGCVLTCAMMLLWLDGRVPTLQLLAIGVGGAAAAVIGFIDDIHQTPAARKFAAHCALSVWLSAVFTYPIYMTALNGQAPLVWVATYAVLLFVPVWLINLYNFIDGIDGMAVGAALCISGSGLIVLLVGDGNTDFMIPFGLLAAISIGFLSLNLPPAKIFMGDAGSIFFGYCFAALAIATVMTNEISVWTWIAMFGYFIGDTTTTTLMRMYLVPRWYGEHRSHAYQNLARIWRSHARVTYGVLAYQVAWCLPLAIWAALQPRTAPLAAALALAPAVYWALRFGPRLSSD